MARKPHPDSLDPNMRVRIEALSDAFARLKNAPGTKAQKLRDAFIQTVEFGLWRPDDPIPSEKDLLAALPISQGTVQAAMRRLADEGIVIRKRGAGSRISRSGERGDTPWFLRFKNADGSKLEPHKTSQFDVSEISESGKWTSALGARSSYIKLKRIVEVTDTVRVLAIAYLDAGRFRPLLDLSTELLSYWHFRHFLHDRFNAPTLEVKELVRWTRASDSVAKILELPANTHILTFETVNLSLRSEAIVYQEFYIPPNDLIFEITASSKR